MPCRLFSSSPSTATSAPTPSTSSYTLDLQSVLKADLKAAMREKDKLRSSVVKGLLSDITYQEKSGNQSKIDPVAILRKAIKRRQDSISQYREANREDLAQAEEAELALLNTYLPPTPSAAELAELIASTAVEIGANSAGDTGRLVKELAKKTQGKGWEMRELADSAKKYLAGVSSKYREL
ncbi:hypothetical protein HDU93_002425 [Gonapodya sp. JEL0774]|nr:hypothetical protein HDU93_002425 [Gonapodya sp. JEL0774]